MDRAILAAGGAYQDRSEYIAEAIRDRLAEEAALVADMAPPARSVPVAEVAAEPEVALKRVAEVPARYKFVTLTEPPFDQSVELGRWRDRAPAWLETTPTDAVNFGLHNRDLPTLWALDRLALLSADVGGPIDWDAFIARIRDEGLYVGSLLRQRDITKPSGLRAGIGFPKPGLKREASIDRFIASAIGSNRRLDGPFWIFALAARTGDDGNIAPTGPGLQVLADMIDRGLGATLPQPAGAFDCWWRYTRDLAPAEHAAWLKVLRVIGDKPTREELTTHFPEWRGQIATTNTVGFISRSREWGLVEPELIDQRYRLTELGRAAAGGG